MVGGVEVSVDGGATWQPRHRPRRPGPTPGRRRHRSRCTIRSRAADDSGNLETPGAGVTVTRSAATQTCPCTHLGPDRDARQAAETTDADADRGRREVPRRRSTGSITGVRFYKGATNTGTHVGHLWSATGTLLATATFTGETASGWQQVTFSQPGRRSRANTTYVASYHAAERPLRRATRLLRRRRRRQRARCTPWPTARTARNGVYAYGAERQLPDRHATRSTNYWVDVVFEPAARARHHAARR